MLDAKCDPEQNNYNRIFTTYYPTLEVGSLFDAYSQVTVQSELTVWPRNQAATRFGVSVASAVR